jgi:signal transduction histidine kinase
MATVQRRPKSLRYFLLVATGYAISGYLLVQLVFNWELDRSSLLSAAYRPWQVFAQTLEVHSLSFFAWLGLSLLGATLAHRVATMLANALQAEERYNTQLMALHRASAALADRTNPDEVIRQSLDLAAQLLGIRVVSFYRWDPDAELLREVDVPGPNGQAPARTLRPGEDLAGQALARRQAVVANNYRSMSWATPASSSSGIQAGLAVPVVRGDVTYGVLVAGKVGQAVFFSDSESRVLSLFVDQVAAALATAEAFEQQRRAVLELERLNQAKTDFVYVVSHELRTPLTSVKGYIDLLLEGEAGPLSPDQLEFLDIARNNADRLVALINDLLDVARIETGNVELQCLSVEMAPLIEEVANSFRPQLEARSQQLSLELDAHLPPVWADPRRVLQVLANLVSNAHKYTPPGGHLTIAAQPEGGYVRLDVRDTGIGMTAEEQAQLFTKFFRSRHGLAQAAGGTGLGLVITRSLVDLHGGSMQVFSTADQGSTFSFTLPVADSAGVPCPRLPSAVQSAVQVGPA